MCVNYDGPLPATAQTPEQRAAEIREDIVIIKRLIAKKQEMVDRLENELHRIETEERRKIEAQMTFDDILGGNE